MGRITEIHRYPVKSMGGESLAKTPLLPNGLPGDRAWAVRDEVRGGIRGAKKIPALMNCRARYEKTPAESGSSTASITLPDGSRLSTHDANASERISDAIGHPVSLWPLLPADALDHYARGAPDHADMEQELRATFARTPDEPLPDLGKFPPEIFRYESPPGTYFDAYPLLILSQQSLDEMSRRAAASRFDVRRFRPNFVVDLPDSDEPFPEAALEARRLRVGSAILEATIACPRCVMTTHGFEDLPRDPGIMRALVADAGGNLGLYARVSEPGEVEVGDPFEIID
ncbi:MAG: MOSC N-terminal beta barrel domain-containing protein [Myxococcota bacterium]|nr:MOSC N-terminal beta barrel domain-containing protein [Myxococcota bacterium]